MTPVTPQESAAIERRIGAVEAATGVQVVAAIVPRSDDYPEIPWRAFALGASVAAFIAIAIDVGRPDWLSAQALLMQAVTILGVAAVAGLVAAKPSPYARLFLTEARAKAETRQCAESLFLTRELFATPRRDAVLVLVSQFEHRVVIVPDVYCRGRVSAAEWESAIAQMTPKLRDGRTGDALIAGLAAIEALMLGKGFGPEPGARTNVLPDALLRGEES
jgi:putative membrane protein